MDLRRSSRTHVRTQFLGIESRGARVGTLRPSVSKPIKDSNISDNPTMPVAGPSKPKAKDLKKKFCLGGVARMLMHPSSSEPKRGAPKKRSMAFLEAESRQGFHGFEPTHAMVCIIIGVLPLLYCIFIQEQEHERDLSTMDLRRSSRNHVKTQFLGVESRGAKRKMKLTKKGREIFIPTMEQTAEWPGLRHSSSRGTGF